LTLGKGPVNRAQPARIPASVDGPARASITQLPAGPPPTVGQSTPRAAGPRTASAPTASRAPTSLGYAHYGQAAAAVALALLGVLGLLTLTGGGSVIGYRHAKAGVNARRLDRFLP
jgi:hypothetical protein